MRGSCFERIAPVLLFLPEISPFEIILAEMSDLSEFFKSITIFINPMWKSWLPTCFFYKQCFSSIEPQCCLTFSWIELQMLPMCCLLHIYKHHYTERHISYSVYFGPRVGLGLFICCILVIYFSFSASFSLPLIL